MTFSARSTCGRYRLMRGFGLVELMVAMVIGLILMTGITQIFTSSKRTYRTAEELSRLQENARYAMHVLRQDLRMGGYRGCAPQPRNMLNPAGDNYSETLYGDQAVGGWNYSGTGYGETYALTTLSPTGAAVSSWDSGEGADGDLSALLKDLAVPGSDVIVIKRLDTDVDVELKGEKSINTSLNTIGSNGIPQYTVLMVTEDCVAADLFQKRNNADASSISAGNGSSTNPGPGNAENKFSKAYSAKAQVMFFRSFAYFIGEGESGEPALFRLQIDGTGTPTPQELVAGVENMQVVYGEDTDSDGVADRYIPIDAVTDPEQIVGVRLSLLMRTEQEVQDQVSSKTYALPGKTTINPADDRRLRYVVTTTVKLRNRGL